MAKARRDSLPASYTSDKMARQLGRGNVAEALFRIWLEDHADALSNLEFRQQGYNPEGIVEVDNKRDQLKRASDPDFAAVRPGTEPPRYVVGISPHRRRG